MSEIGEAAEIEDAKKMDGLGGRPAAGEDPVKRAQIMDGAMRVFMRMGFDASSMNDITREAGVSKGTLYVYFKNKEDLFAAIIQRKKSLVFQKQKEVLDAGHSIRETLHEFGVMSATHILSDDAIRGQRIVIGVIDRMPELADSFFKTGPNTPPVMLANYFEDAAHRGLLKPLEDPLMTARQFGDLCLAGLYRQRLFGEMREAPPQAVIERNINAAVTLFLNTYGPEAA